MSLGARIYTELRGDRVIWMIIAVLAMFSILSVYSATGSLAYKMAGGDTERYLLKHSVILGFGLVLTYFAYLTHYAKFKNMAPWLLLITIPLLVFTIAMGPELNGARRWIQIPYVGITFQTSDLAKLALILFVAREITKHKDYIQSFEKAFMPIIVPILMVVALIAPSDLSTALLLFFTCISMMFVGRIDWKYIALTFILGIVVFACLIIIGEFAPDFVRVDTWVNRMKDFLSSGSGEKELGYQVQHSMMAIANGDVIGVGPGNSVMRNYLPAPYSDFIYSTITEEYGLLGSLLILSMYVLLFFRAVRLVTKSDKSFGGMAALGITMIIVFQALANMAVSVNLVPVTGLTLPLVSMGGTSILFTCISFGIILSVSKFVEAEAEMAEVEVEETLQQGGGKRRR
ncbi:MAG: cell division protein FtsW [Saprospiraceae bacterium]|jgi:cell division protein FtsW